MQTIEQLLRPCFQADDRRSTIPLGNQPTHRARQRAFTGSVAWSSLILPSSVVLLTKATSRGFSPRARVTAQDGGAAFIASNPRCGRGAEQKCRRQVTAA